MTCFKTIAVSDTPDPVQNPLFNTISNLERRPVVVKHGQFGSRLDLVSVGESCTQKGKNRETGEGVTEGGRTQPVLGEGAEAGEPG